MAMGISTDCHIYAKPTIIVSYIKEVPVMADAPPEYNL